MFFDIRTEQLHVISEYLNVYFPAVSLLRRVKLFLPCSSWARHKIDIVINQAYGEWKDVLVIASYHLKVKGKGKSVLKHSSITISVSKSDQMVSVFPLRHLN